MDWSNIFNAAIYGAIGGGVGALVGALLAAPFQKMKIGKMTATIFTVAGVVIGYNVAEPLLKPYIGDHVSALVGKSSSEKAIEDIIAELRTDPLLEAILDKEPMLEGEFRTDLLQILENETDAKKARKSAFSITYEQVSSRLSYYLARGRDEDIIAFTSVVVDLMNYLKLADPQFCHRFFYDPSSLSGIELPELKAKFGGTRHQVQQEAAALVVNNAFEQIPVYDEQAALLTVKRAGEHVYEVLGDDLIGLINVGGQKPKNDEEAAAACAATSGLFQLMLDSDNAADAIRHIYRL